MKPIFTLVLIFIFSIAAQAQTIEGIWKTIDDQTEQAKSHVKIYKAKNGKYYGKIIKILNRPANEPKNPKCIKCPKKDYRYNQPILGMAIVSKLKAKKDLKSATNGKVLDPESGKIYDCKITLADNGKKLKLRGYLGIPSLGRTQTWIRLK